MQETYKISVWRYSILERGIQVFTKWQIEKKLIMLTSAFTEKGKPKFTKVDLYTLNFSLTLALHFSSFTHYLLSLFLLLVFKFYTL